MCVLFLFKHVRQHSQTRKNKSQYLALQNKPLLCRHTLCSSTRRQLTLKLPFWENFGGWGWWFEILPFYILWEIFSLVSITSILMFRHPMSYPTFTPPPRHAKVLQHGLQDLFRGPSSMDHIIDLGGGGPRSRQASPKSRCHLPRSVWNSDLLTESKWIKAKPCKTVLCLDLLVSSLALFPRMYVKGTNLHLSVVNIFGAVARLGLGPHTLYKYNSLPSCQGKQGSTTSAIWPQKPDSLNVTWGISQAIGRMSLSILFFPNSPYCAILWFLRLIHPRHLSMATWPSHQHGHGHIQLWKGRKDRTKAADHLHRGNGTRGRLILSYSMSVDKMAMTNTWELHHLLFLNLCGW